jgi:hypothetical protein
MYNHPQWIPRPGFEATHVGKSNSNREVFRKKTNEPAARMAGFSIVLRLYFCRAMIVQPKFATVLQSAQARDAEESSAIQSASTFQRHSLSGKSHAEDDLQGATPVEEWLQQEN